MHNFVVQSYGYVSDLEPFDDPTVLHRVRDHAYRFVIGLLGGAGTDSYCFGQASRYTIVVGSGTVSGPSQYFTSWGQVHQATVGSPNVDCPATLGGEPIYAATGYWGNLMPAIAYAVDHGAPGAAASWQRMSGAPNWSVLEDAEWQSDSPWAIVPRGFE